MRRLVCAILLGCASASLGEVARADEQADRTLDGRAKEGYVLPPAPRP